MLIQNERLLLEKKTVIYISSLSHSGSTLLDMILGGHPKIIGLGEMVHAVDKERPQITCSCGKVFEQCIFWSKVAQHLGNRKNLDLRTAYKIIFQTFEQVFGKEYLLLDSSKSIYTLKKLINIENIEFKVIYIMKDVRSYTISQIDTLKRNNRKFTLKTFFFNTIYFFLQWYYNNIKNRRFFKKYNIQFIQIGYEELCLYPNDILTKICEFLGIQMDTNMLNVNSSKSHIFWGNRMKSQKDKHKIMYDNRWFSRNRWIIPSILFPFILRYNSKQVYSNDTHQIWGNS